jgi:2-polyprenyl-6-methoxyphenol hydroxylase-like FAD-dependent oxidoreductase
MTALLLQRHGWSVDVFERSEVELAGRGAGIVTHQHLFDALHAAGVEITADLGVRVEGRRVFDHLGSTILQLAYTQILTSWDRLYHALRSCLPDGRYHLGHALESVESSTEAVVARFAGRADTRAELLVGADGFRSSVRQGFFPDTVPNYAGYVAWRGLVDEADVTESTKLDLFEHFCFSLPKGEQMLGYPVAGVNNDMRIGRRRYNWVWYRPAEEALELRNLLTDAKSNVHELSIPPRLIRRDLVEDLRRSALCLAPQFQELVRLTEQPFFQPIYDLETPRMAIGRVALVGDAAFVARPHVGAGVTKAAQDALSLTNSLGNADGSVEMGLLAFEHERKAVGAKIIRRARQLGAYMQSQVSTRQERQDAELHRTPEAVVRETASLEFLH